MESTGVAGKAQCTAHAAAVLRAQDPAFQLTRRGEVEVKGRGLMETFFVDGRHGGPPMWDKAGGGCPGASDEQELNKGSGSGLGSASRRSSGGGEGNPARQPSSKELLLPTPSQENPGCVVSSPSSVSQQQQPVGASDAGEHARAVEQREASGASSGGSSPSGGSSSSARAPVVVVAVANSDPRLLAHASSAWLSPPAKPQPAARPSRLEQVSAPATLGPPPTSTFQRPCTSESTPNPSQAASGGRKGWLAPLPHMRLQAGVYLSVDAEAGARRVPVSRNRVAPEQAVHGPGTTPTPRAPL
eukprot:919322-Rhodomonas_salina.2